MQARTGSVALLSLTVGCSISTPTGPALDSGLDEPDGASVLADAGQGDAEARFGPPPGFMDPDGDRALVFELRGLINEGLVESEATFGQGSARALLGEGREEVLQERVLSYVHTFGLESGAELAGKRLVALRLLQIDRSTPSNALSAVMALVGLRQDRLRELAAGSTAVLGPGDLHYAAVRRIDHVVREDRVALSRDCTLGLADLQHDSVRVLVDGRRNSDFEQGETVFAWGHLPLVTDVETLGGVLGKTHDLVDGLYCTCTRGAERIPCSTWEEQQHQSGSYLSCTPPDELLSPRSPSRSIFAFSGTIQAAGGSSVPLALASFDTEVAGVPAPLDYLAYVERLSVGYGSFAGREVLDVTALGDLQQQAAGRMTYNALKLRVAVSLLETLVAEARAETSQDEAKDFIAALYRVEHVDQDQSTHLKLCPWAVSAGPAAHSTLHLCREASGTFAVGEQLEMAGQIVLTDDPVVLAGWFGSAGACSCSKDGEAIACDAFPEP